MKFTDGYWQLRKGVTMHRPAEAYDVTAAPDRLTIYAPARPIGHRADTLNNALLTVELWSPLEGVIGVRLTHFAGGQNRGPHFVPAARPSAARALGDREAPPLAIRPLRTSGGRSSGLSHQFLGGGPPTLSRPPP